MTTTIQIHDVVIAQIFDEIEGLRTLTKEVLAGIRTAVELTVLQLTITDVIHDLLELSRLIAIKERIPLPTPDDLNHVPTSTTKYTFKLLDNFTIASNGAIEALKVTVNNKVKVA